MSRCLCGFAGSVGHSTHPAPPIKAESVWLQPGLRLGLFPLPTAKEKAVWPVFASSVSAAATIYCSFYDFFSNS